MAKKRYMSPIILSGLTPEDDDPIIVIGNSQGTSGNDPQFTWDPKIDPDYIDMFWLSYDETDLASIDTDGDLYISYDEFMAWYDEEQPW